MSPQPLPSRPTPEAELSPGVPVPYLVRERTPVTEEPEECPEAPVAPGSHRGVLQ